MKARPSQTHVPIPTIFIVLVLILKTEALSLSGQKQYNASAYGEALMQQQLQFTQKVNEIKQEMKNVRSIFDNTTITNNAKLVQASEGIADERNTLYDMQQILKLPWQLRECKCASLNQTARDLVNQKIEYIQTLIKDMRSSLKKCDQVRCPRYEEIAMELSQSQNYLAIMAETINSECCKGDYKFKPQTPTGLVDLSNTIYKDNLNAKNWYYGDIDKKQFTLKRFELATKYNLTSCPIYSPYADLLSNTCTQCLEPSKFNLGSRACISCPGYNKYVDEQTSSCLECPFPQFYNVSAKACQRCPQQYKFNLTTLKCQQCNGLNQYARTSQNKCLRCAKQQYYDAQSKSCKGCDIVGGKFLNKTTNLCDICPLGTRYVIEKGACTQCQNLFHYDPNLGKCVTCPTNTVYIKSNNTCQGCIAPSFYSNLTKTCQTCPSGTKFNITLNVCTNITTTGHVSCPKDQPYYDRYTKVCSACPENQILDSSTHTCKPHNYISYCPPDKPVYNTTILACMPCPKLSTYDPVEHVCKGINCKDYEYLDLQTLKCLAIESTCTTQQYYDNNTKKCVLLSNKCNTAIELFSQSLGKCVPFDQACSKGYYFDTTQKKCVSVVDLCKSTQYYSYQKSQCLPLSTTCSSDQYFNETLKQCTARSSLCTQSQYYNQSLHQCRQKSQQCKKGQRYDTSSNKCVSIQSSCSIDQYYNSTSYQCQQKSFKCTLDEIYVQQQHQCLSKELYCTSSEFYSRVMHACISGMSLCHVNQYYDKPTNSCKLISSLCQANGTVYDAESNRCYRNCQTGYVLDKSVDKCIPATSVTPVGPVTQNCKQDQTYLADVGQCVKTIATCTSKQFYNWKTYKCESPTYITSPYSANLLSQDRPFSEYQSYYSSKVQEYSQIPDGLRDCAPSTPHYDPSTLSCMFCSGQNFLFDVVNNKCTKCANGLAYSSSGHHCIQV